MEKSFLILQSTLLSLKKEREGKRAEKTQGLKVLWRSRRSGIHCPPFFTHHKAISHIPNLVAVNDFDSEAKVVPELQFLTDPMVSMLSMLQCNLKMYCLVQIDNFIVQAFGNLLLEVFICGPQGARLQNLYKSWEENPDIGFVVMKVTSVSSFQLLGPFVC
ncbi:hypothetical protein AAG906_020804 [Vitis piasezkii]